MACSVDSFQISSIVCGLPDEKDRISANELMGNWNLTKKAFVAHRIAGVTDPQVFDVSQIRFEFNGHHLTALRTAKNMKFAIQVFGSRTRDVLFCRFGPPPIDGV